MNDVAGVAAPSLSSAFDLIGGRAWAHGGVIEVSLLKTHKGTVRGYFEGAAAAMQSMHELPRSLEPEGVYVTLNPIRRDLLARAVNRFEPFAKTRAADVDVLRRLWLPIDADPQRPAGISATQEELGEAVARTDAVVAWLQSEYGWPDPIRGSGGNSGHGVFAIDEPNDVDTDRLMKHVYAVLAARFSDDAVNIDTAVSNAGRIWTLYGTLKRKGDNTITRPHRRSWMAARPDPLQLVSRVHLEAVAAMDPVATRDTRLPRSTGTGTILDMRAEFERRGWYVRELSPGKHGVRCPWADAHTSISGASETVLFEPRSSGEVWGFRCQHAHCVDKSIRQVWEMLRTPWRETQVTTMDTDPPMSTIGKPPAAPMGPSDRKGPLRFLTLRERLARPRLPRFYRIENWQGAGSRVMLTAQFKAGKTTLVGNVVRGLVDGGLLLGRDAVTPITGTVVLLDFEMGEDQLEDWLRDQRIEHDDRVIVEALKGRISAFDILNPEIRQQWAQKLHDVGCEYLILDCLRPVMDALGLDEQNEAGRLLVPFDALLAEAGIPEALVVHHMGHANERSRGDSRLRDWPDVEWRLVRQDADNPASRRFLSAYGRDVDVPECQLGFDPETRRLTVAGGSRRDMKAAVALDDIVALLRGTSMPLSGRAIKEALIKSEHPRQTIESSLTWGVCKGVIAVEDGPRNAQLYRVHSVSVPVSRSVPSVSQDTASECPNAYRHGTLGHSPNDPPQAVDSRDTQSGDDDARRF